MSDALHDSHYNFDERSYQPTFQPDGSLHIQGKELFSEAVVSKTQVDDKLKKLIRDGALPYEVASLERALMDPLALRNISQLHTYANALSHYLTSTPDLRDVKELRARVLQAEAHIGRLKELEASEREKMVQGVVASTRTIANPKDKQEGDGFPLPFLPVQEGTLFIGEKPGALQKKEALSVEERLLDAFKAHKPQEAREILSRISDPLVASQMVQKLFKIAAEENDPASYTSIFFELIQLCPYMNLPTMPEERLLTEVEMQGSIKQAIQAIKDDPKIDYVVNLPTGSLRQFLEGLKDHPLLAEEHNGIIKTLQTWAKAGKYTLCFQALKELQALYPKEALGKIVEAIADDLLQAVADTENHTLYYSALYKLKSLYQDIGKFIVHDKDGVFKADSIDLIVKYLEGQNIVSKNRPSDHFKALFSSLNSNARRAVVEDTMRNLAGNRSHVLYCFFLHELSKIFPDIRRTYITPRGVLKPEAIRVLINHLQEKGIIDPDMPCHVFDTMPEFFEAVKDLPEDFVRGCFIVRHFKGPGADSQHVTHVFLEKREGALRALTTDSTETSSKFTTAVQLGLCRTFPEIQIGSFTVRRQSDRTNCPIIELLDLIYVSNNPDIMKPIDGENPPQMREILDPFQDPPLKTGFAFYDFDQTYIPPGMMRVTQSVTTLKDYLSASSEQPTMMTQTQSVEKLVKKHYVTVVTEEGEKQQNLLALKRFFRYSRLLTLKAIEPALVDMA